MKKSVVLLGILVFFAAPLAFAQDPIMSGGSDMQSGRPVQPTLGCNMSTANGCSCSATGSTARCEINSGHTEAKCKQTGTVPTTGGGTTTTTCTMTCTDSGSSCSCSISPVGCTTTR